jgi:hypothetical protein
MTNKTQPASSSKATEEPVKKKIGRPRGAGFYLSNADLLTEWYKSRDQDRVTNEFARMIQLMSEKISGRNFYTEYRDRQDCIAGGVEDALQYWRGFNPEKGTNAFAYFSSVVFNGQQKAWHRCHPLREKNTIRLSDNMGKYM